jgi:hypothetical protein
VSSARVVMTTRGMTKHKPKSTKLNLHLETVRRLSTGELGAIQGGLSTSNCPLSYACPSMAARCTITIF